MYVSIALSYSLVVSLTFNLSLGVLTSCNYKTKMNPFALLSIFVSNRKMYSVLNKIILYIAITFLSASYEFRFKQTRRKTMIVNCVVIWYWNNCNWTHDITLLLNSSSLENSCNYGEGFCEQMYTDLACMMFILLDPMSMRLSDCLFEKVSNVLWWWLLVPILKKLRHYHSCQRVHTII